MWIDINDQEPPTNEPVVYCRKRHDGGVSFWSVGIAYWTVSKKWKPEMESLRAPSGFTHWMPLPSNPENPINLEDLETKLIALLDQYAKCLKENNNITASQYWFNRIGTLNGQIILGKEAQKRRENQCQKQD